MTIVTKLPPSLGPGSKAGRGAAQNFSRAPPIAKHLVQLMKLSETIIQHDQKLEGPFLKILTVLFLTGTLRIKSNLELKRS